MSGRFWSKLISTIITIAYIVVEVINKKEESGKTDNPAKPE